MRKLLLYKVCLNLSAIEGECNSLKAKKKKERKKKFFFLTDQATW